MKAYCIKLFSILLLFAASSCSKAFEEPVSDFDFEPLINETAKTNLYQQILDEYCALGLPGLSLSIESSDDGLWLGSAGMASIEGQIKMKPGHVHHSASIAKPFISSLILMLAEDGMLSLDDRAKDYLPKEIYTNISNAEKATIRQLMNHTSGIYGFLNNKKLYIDTFNDPLVNASTEMLFEKYVYDLPAYFEVGENFYYSNTNYSLLGMIIEQVSGTSLGEYLEQKIIVPLHLENTYYKASDGFPNVKRVVNNYYELFPQQLQNCTDIQKHFSNIAMGHEGIIANPYDYAVFMKALVGGELLSDESRAQMKNIKETAAFGHTYGLGLNTYETDYEVGFGHTGGSIGSMSIALYFPESDVSFSLCCNLGTVFESANTDRFYYDIYDELLHVIFTGSRL